MIEHEFEIKENRWAQVDEKHVVVNVIKWDGKTEILGFPPKGHKLIKCSKFVGVGDTYAPIENAFIKGKILLK